METPEKGHGSRVPGNSTRCDAGTKAPATASAHFGFWSLIFTQFQGAFNDNALKFLVIYLVIERNLSSALRDQLVLLVGALFALPFVLFSLSGGFLADRYSKRSVTIGTKIYELAVMLFALAALTMASLPMEAAAVFLISSQGAFFGPAKYGLLPELLPEKELSWGNGVIELGTFLAAIGATVAAGYLAAGFRGHQFWSGIILLGCTLVGLVTSLGVTHVPAADPQKRFRANPFADFGTQLRIISRDRALGWAVVGNTYVWFLAALLQFVIVIYGHDVLRVNETEISYLQAAVGIGIGLGSMTAGYLSGGKIEIGLIPLGAMGMTVFGFLVSRPGLNVWSVRTDLAFLGFFGGFYAVPLSAMIQYRPRPDQKGGVIAASNLLSFIGIFAAAGAYYLFSSVARLQAGQIFFAGAVLTLGATLYAVFFLPDSLLRLALWLLTHSLYHIHVEGRDNIPERGGALFVCNEMSYLDAALLISSTDRPVRFLMPNKFYRRPYVLPFARLSGAIPIPSTKLSDEVPSSIRAAHGAIRSGEVLSIFPERGMTRDATLLPFRCGLEGLMKNVDAPIVPVCITGAWGTIFHFEKGHFAWKFPGRLLSPIIVTYGAPLPGGSSLADVLEGVRQTGKPVRNVSR